VLLSVKSEVNSGLYRANKLKASFLCPCGARERLHLVTRLLREMWFISTYRKKRESLRSVRPRSGGSTAIPEERGGERNDVSSGNLEVKKRKKKKEEGSFAIFCEEKGRSLNAPTPGSRPISKSNAKRGEDLIILEPRVTREESNVWEESRTSRRERGPMISTCLTAFMKRTARIRRRGEAEGYFLFKGKDGKKRQGASTILLGAPRLKMDYDEVP